MTAAALVLAHQGGWDEMLFVLVPISVFAWLLSLANKRAIREQAGRDDTDGGSDSTDDGSTDDGPDGEPDGPSAVDEPG